ncbi:MAG: hypothetical protein ABSD74_02675 [Rhizomicrobium sp.]
MSVPLYHQIRSLYGYDRMPFSYDVENIGAIDSAVGMIHADFVIAAGDFFEGTFSIRELRDRIVQRPFGTAAGIYAIVLTYLLDPQITAGEIDSFVRLSPNQMTERFAANFKNKLGAERSRA